MKTIAVKLVHTKNLTDLEWLQYRQKGIGGSDAAGLVGLNKYKSPLAVFKDKVDEIDASDVSFPSEAAEMGTELEPVIRGLFKKKNPELKVQQSFIMWHHPDYPFMLANVDGIVYDAEKGWGVLEVKNSSEWRTDEWSEDEVPEEYLIQMQHYLAVFGFAFGWFAVLIGGNKFRQFYVERDESLINDLISIEKHFWNDNVIALNPPLPDGSDSSGEVLAELYSFEKAKEKKEILQLPEETQYWFRRYEQAKEEEKQAKKEKNEAKNHLVAQLGDYQLGTLLIDDEERQVKNTVSQAFDEEEFAKNEPELFKQYAKPKIDKGEVRKKHPKVYKQYMVDSGRTFGIKEDEAEYMGVS